jgi:hypothetical protein
MAAETLCIHILWSIVTGCGFFAIFRCVDKYTTLKSLEAIAMGSEKIALVMLQVLNKRPMLRESLIGDFVPHNAPQNGPQNGPHGRKHNHSTSKTKENESYSQPNTLFDLYQ